MGATEITRKNAFLKKLKKVAPDILIFGIADRFSRGRPDSLIMRRGKTVWTEFKMYPNKPTPIQAAVIKSLQQAGQNVLVVSFKEDTILIETEDTTIEKTERETIALLLERL